MKTQQGFFKELGPILNNKWENNLGRNSYQIILLTQTVLKFSGMLPYSVCVVDDELEFSCPRFVKSTFIGLHLTTVLLTTLSLITNNLPLLYKGVDPNSQFEIVGDLLRWAAAVNFFYVMWLKQKGLKHICQVAHKLYGQNYQIKRKLPSKSVIAAGVLCVIPFVRFGYMLTNSIGEMLTADNAKQIQLIHLSSSAFFSGNEDSLWKKILFNTFVILQCYGVLLFSFSIFTVHLISWAFYQLCHEIEATLESLKPNSETVIKIYEDAKELVEAINSALSGHFVVLTGMAIVSFSRYLSSPFDLLMDSENHIQVILHITFAVSFFFIGAEGTCKLQGIAGYIFTQRRNPSYQNNPEISLVLKEMAMNPLGMKAKTMLLNYSFFTTVLSTCITYTIVCLQFSLAQNQNC